MAGTTAQGDGRKEYEDWMASQGDDYIGKEKKADWWNNWNSQQQSQDMMNTYMTNPGGGFYMNGSGAEQQAQAANLSQVGAQTGQNLMTTGGQQQEYLKSLQDRRAGSDAVGQYMMGERNRNMANVGRQFAGKGVSGGVAAAGMNSAQNGADASINAELQKNGRTNDQDLFNYVKRQQKVEGEAIAMGKDQGLAQNISVDTGQGITVICTELHRQGLMDNETYAKDAEFGRHLMANDPHVLPGYTVWAVYVAALMQKSPLFTKIIAPFALAWAAHIAGRKNLLGAIILHTGVPVCRVIGKLRSKEVYARV